MSRRASPRSRPVVATDPVGALTGRRYPDSLIAPDKRGIQPRIGVAWRPVPGSSLVDPRRLRHLSQHLGLSVDRDAAGAAAAAVEDASASRTAPQSADAGQRASSHRPGAHAQHVRGRSRLPRRLCAELAGVGAARPARVADRVATYLGTRGSRSDAAVPAEHLSRRAPRIHARRVRRDSSISRRTADRRGTPVSSSCGAGCATASPRLSVHVGEGDRRRGGLQRARTSPAPRSRRTG